MVAPVTGPFIRYPTFPFSDAYQRGYRQEMPIDQPLEYRSYWYFGMTKTDSWTHQSYSPGIWTKQADWSLTSIPDYLRERAACYNLAYERLRSQAMDTAGWAENLAQINQTRDLFNKRAVQLYRIANAARKGRFQDAARHAGLLEKYDRKTGRRLLSEKSGSKRASGFFLEYEYGIKPLVSDLQETLKILTSASPSKQVRGKASSRIAKSTGAGGGFGSNPRCTYTERTIYEGWLELTLRANCVVTSPNLLLANQLGLIDLALPWKLVPFSFVVDWFINVEQVASSLTDWYGVTLQHPHVSEFSRGQYYYNYHQLANYYSGALEGLLIKRDKEYVDFNRTMGIPGPSLVVKPFKGLSINRGLQAVALIVQIFGK